MIQLVEKGCIRDYETHITKNVIKYIERGETTAFEGFFDYNLLYFEWYDVEKKGVWMAPILIYQDGENLFFICEHESTLRKAAQLLGEIGQSGQGKNLGNEDVLYLFFAGLLRRDMEFLNDMEDEITEAEDETLLSSNKEYLKKIISYRKELLRLKRYYEQMDAVLDNLTANANGLLSEEATKRFEVLANRTERFRSAVINLRDYVTQMREAYQAQIDIEQNSLMKVFTVVTSIFMPLTLMVGWYGMNFEHMPELSGEYSYWIFVGASIFVGILLILWFHRKKWI